MPVPSEGEKKNCRTPQGKIADQRKEKNQEKGCGFQGKTANLKGEIGSKTRNQTISTCDKKERKAKGANKEHNIEASRKEHNIQTSRKEYEGPPGTEEKKMRPSGGA